MDSGTGGGTTDGGSGTSAMSGLLRQEVGEMTPQVSHAGSEREREDDLSVNPNPTCGNTPEDVRGTRQSGGPDDHEAEIVRQMGELDGEVPNARAACTAGKMPYRMRTGYISHEAFCRWMATNEDHLNHSWWEEGHVDVMEGCSQVHGFVRGALFGELYTFYDVPEFMVGSGARLGLNPDVIVRSRDAFPILAEIGYSQTWRNLHVRRVTLLGKFPGVQYVVLVKADPTPRALTAEVWDANADATEPLSRVGGVVAGGGAPVILSIPPVRVSDGAVTPPMTMDVQQWADMLDAEGKWDEPIHADAPHGTG